MKWLLAVLVGIVVGVAFERRRDPVFLDIVTGKRFYITERTRASHESFWRDLERVDSV